MGSWINIKQSNLLFIILTFSLIVLKFLENFIVFTPLYRAYCYDVLAVPIIAFIALKIQQYLTYKNTKYRFKAIHIIFITLYVSLVFEFILPYFNNKYTQDYYDVVAYGVGALFFLAFMNK